MEETMKTASSWGSPPPRFYRFLKRVQLTQCPSYDFDLAVLGCADGKFVLPAARKGLRVFAIDVDEIALFGGQKLGIGGNVEVLGLSKRLKAEALSLAVTISKGDFAETPPVKCRSVWVSGAVQYSFNQPKSAAQLVDKTTAYVASGGLLYIDYMLPYEDKYKGRANCPDAEWWQHWGKTIEGWTLLYNRVFPPSLDRAHVEFPVDHYHQWGHILLRKG
jgi:hypothetical protein